MSAGQTWTVGALLRWTAPYFQSKGIESPRLDAELLLAFALQTERLRLYLDFEKPVTAAERARFRELVQRRAGQRVPTAQLTGEREFWSLPLRITPDVLIPRPDTETLVEAVLAQFPGAEAAPRILDLGTGSGAIALALASERPRAQLTASDVSSAALAVAEQNAGRLGLDGRLRLLAGCGFAPVAGERFDAVVSNPPYLSRAEAGSLAPELAHEPELALFAGEDGGEALRHIIAAAPGVLEAGGLLALEIAPAQAAAVREWLAQAGFAEIETRRDLGGNERAVLARLDAKRPGAKEGGA